MIYLYGLVLFAWLWLLGMLLQVFLFTTYRFASDMSEVFSK